MSSMNKAAANPPGPRKLSAVEILARDVRAITPKGMEHLASLLLLRGKSFDEIRLALLAEYNRRHPQMKDVSDEQLQAALCGLPE